MSVASLLGWKERDGRNLAKGLLQVSSHCLQVLELLRPERRGTTVLCRLVAEVIQHAIHAFDCSRELWVI